MANIFKATDSGSLVGMLRDFALSIRQFFGTKSEMDVVATALTDLERRKIEASDIPTSLPANGGNADTVDGEHSSAFAHIGAHNNLTASGNEFTFASSGFSGTIWLNYRTAGGANGNITEYKFGNGAGDELGTAIHSGNYNSYSPTLTGAGASGTWGINISGNAATASNVEWSGVTNKPSSFTPSSHTHTKSEITDFPTNVSEFTNDAGYITSSDSKFGNYFPVSGGTVTGNLYLTGLEEGTSNVTDNTEILTSYASNNGFADTNATGKVYRRGAIKVYNYIKGKLDSVYSAIRHTHTKSDISDFPTSLPANGGNADTVDGYHAADFVLKTAHDEHEMVIAQSLTDLDRRIDEAIPTISVGSVTTVDAGKDAQVTISETGEINFSIPRGADGKNGVSPIIEIGTVNTVPSTESASVEKTGTIDHVIFNFSIPSGADGDMWELDDEGYVDSNGDKVTDYCTAGLSWQMLSKQGEGYDFISNIEVPVPNVEAMIMLADCIKQTVDISLGVVKNPFFDNYYWKELHWLLRCSRTDNIVYTTKYAIPDAEYPTVIDSESNAYFPPTTIEISVSCNKTPGNGARYVQITIENQYGRAYYTSANFKKQIIKS